MKLILTFVFIFIYLNSSVISGDISGKKLFCQLKKKINYDQYPFNFGEILDYYAYVFGYEEVHYYYFLRDKDKILFRKKNSNKYTTNENHIEWFENWSDENYHNKCEYFFKKYGLIFPLHFSKNLKFLFISLILKNSFFNLFVSES